MKKTMLSLLIGIGIGIFVIIGIFFLLVAKPESGNVVSSKDNTGDTETMSESVEESDKLWEETESTEIQLTELEETESEMASEEEPSSEETPLDCPYYIKVNRQANCVTIYKKDAEGNYTEPVKAMACSVGLTGKTPLGVSKITARYKWRQLFGGTYGQYTVRFNGHILFHSVPYTETKKDALQEGQFNMLGEPASKGCVRLSVADAKWIYDNCKNGTKVEVYDSLDPGPLGKPDTYKISEDSPYKGWDPTDPDPANPWKTGKVSILGVKNISINQGETVNLLNGVTAVDVDGLSLPVTVSHMLDTNIPGTYKITYSATGVLWMNTTITATVTVNKVEQSEPNVPETEESGTAEQPGDTEIPEDSESSEGSETPEDTETSEDTEIPENVENIRDEEKLE